MAEVVEKKGDQLPLREVPGVTGISYFGAFIDRLHYFWFDGPDKYFADRMSKYNSTVFRTNMPPTPPGFAGDPRVVILLDSKSFRTLFDNSLVDTSNVLGGHYMMSTEFTGGFRVLSYLDTAEDQHTRLKSYVQRLFMLNAHRWLPEIRRAVEETWDKLQSQLPEAKANGAFGSCIFNFLSRTLFRRDPLEPGPASVGEEGASLCLKWLAPQLAPGVNIGLPQPLEEIVFHTFPWPYCTVKRVYQKLYAFFKTYGGQALEIAENEFGITKEEAIHNLIFMFGLNAVAGFSLFLPALIKHIADQGIELHKRLAEEVRNAIKEKGDLNFEAINAMPLLKSVVYEALRIQPPVPRQYARARKDLIVESHEARFLVKKGELMCGYQPFAMKDPKLFDRPTEFLPDRFVGEEGEKLIGRVWWSNGPETEEPTPHNKQCPGKDIVVLTGRLVVAVLFSKFDTLTVKAPSESKVIITSLTPKS
ncbi:allene oxide synthase 2, chloroplastic-like [Nymphaea colorata]|nr:allene oxide synthase 2, chloroplastic-like [Nymphaea colorata]